MIREHKSMPTIAKSPLQQVGYLEVGELFEQKICWYDQVRLSSFLKQTRAPKKKKKPPQYDPCHPHVSTAKLLEAARSSP